MNKLEHRNFRKSIDKISQKFEISWTVYSSFHQLIVICFSNADLIE